MTKAEANRRLRKIYSRLKDTKPTIVVNSKLGKCFGQISAEFEIKDGCIDFSHLIELNPNKSGKSFIKTIIHECLHLAYWNEKEKQILKWENDMFELLSDRQVTNLLRRLYGVHKKLI